MKVKELIKILQEINPNDKACIQTKEGIKEVVDVQQSCDADYNEIYIVADKNVGESK